jgi:catechol 2,3-dioxygenase-like lactoylglutathione lyase family enzyme
LPKLISDIGHIILQVGDMDEAIKLYRDTLGFELKEQSPEWTVITTNLGELTLYKTRKITPLVLRDADHSPIDMHVISFEEAANELEKKGYSVKRAGRSSGTLIDPWGNRLDLHDHRKP